MDPSLPRFYAEARKKDGTVHGRSALLSFKYSIERYLKNPPLNRGISINSDATFSKSNKMLDSVLRNTSRLGKEKVQYKPLITENDLQKLQESGVFNTQEPLGLLRATWFYVTLHFCRRGHHKNHVARSKIPWMHTQTQNSGFQCMHKENRTEFAIQIIESD